MSDTPHFEDTRRSVIEPAEARADVISTRFALMQDRRSTLEARIEMLINRVEPVLCPHWSEKAHLGDSEAKDAVAENSTIAMRLESEIRNLERLITMVDSTIERVEL